jgi:hypothetical protein
MLKVEELIARLEDLKKEIGSGKGIKDKEDFELDGGEESGSSSPAEPQGRTGAGPETKTKTSAEPKTWKGFLSFLAQNWPSIATILKNGDFKGKENGQVTVEFSSDDFCFKFFNDNSRLAQVNQCLEEYFGESLRLVCAARKATEGKPENIPPGVEKEELKKKLLQHPMIEKTIELFDASIDEVKTK